MEFTPRRSGVMICGKKVDKTVDSMMEDSYFPTVSGPERLDHKPLGEVP